MSSALTARAAWLALLALTVSSAGCGAGCGSHATAPATSHTDTKPVTAAQSATPNRRDAVRVKRGTRRLPEDPIAGKKSELQWAEHQKEEEHEREEMLEHADR